MRMSAGHVNGQLLAGFLWFYRSIGADLLCHLRSEIGSDEGKIGHNTSLIKTTIDILGSEFIP